MSSGKKIKASGVPAGKPKKVELGHKCHMSFWISDWNEVACSRFDPKKFIAQLAGTGVKWIEPTIKCCHGNCNYPTKVGKFSGHDIIGPLAQEAHKARLFISVSFQFQCDEWAWNHHANWRIQYPEGQDAIPPAFLPWILCASSPYQDFAARQIEEFTSRYDLDGVFIDFPDSVAPLMCCCDHCKKAYQQWCGEVLPYIRMTENKTIWPYAPKVHPDDFSTYQKVHQFWEFRRSKLFSRYRRIIKKNRPGAMVGANGVGQPGKYNDPLFQAVDYQMIEAHAPEFEDQVRKTKIMVSQGLPAQIYTPGTNFMWATRSVKPLPLLKLESSLVLVNSGLITFGIEPHEAGDFIPGDINTWNQAYRWANRIGRIIKGTQNISDVLVLWTRQSPALSKEEMSFTTSMAGIVKSLLAGHFLFDISNDAADFKQYKLVILPDGTTIDPGIAQRLGGHVAQGGSLLAFGKAGLVDSSGQDANNYSIADLYGADYRKTQKLRSSFIQMIQPEHQKVFSSGPLLIKGDSIMAKPVNAVEIAHTLLPWEQVTPERNVWWLVDDAENAPEPNTGFPAVLENRLGRGRVIYVPSPVDANVASRGRLDPWPARLIGILAASLMKNKGRLRVEAPPGVWVFLRQNKNSSQIHVINTYYGSPGLLSTREELGPHLSDIKITMPKAFIPDVKTISSLIGKNTIEVKTGPNDIEIVMKKVGVHEIIIGKNHGG
jgi:hypothetical protein